MTRDEAVLTVELMKTGVKLNEAGCDRLLTYLRNSIPTPKVEVVEYDESTILGAYTRARGNHYVATVNGRYMHHNTEEVCALFAESLIAALQGGGE